MPEKSGEFPDTLIYLSGDSLEIINTANNPVKILNFRPNVILEHFDFWLTETTTHDHSGQCGHKLVFSLTPFEFDNILWLFTHEGGGWDVFLVTSGQHSTPRVS